ncbi:MAG: hypothetical protein JST06_08950 [Bacteroidetes bacterium]|nr:hypothetical protein [Bacteroidota bacterium]MBS1628684.1 hypothetical protein [Bacteroidota bacterium]
MNYRTFLNPLLERLHEWLLQQTRSYAEYLQVPQEWLLQFLSTNLQPGAKDVAGATVLAQGVFNHYLLSRCGVDIIREALAMEAGNKAEESPLCLACAFESLLGTFASYYDLYAALAWPEMIGKPDDWEAQTESGPFGKAAFKEYVRSTVPTERHEQVFGKAA